MKWIKARERLPNYDKKVFVEWQGFYDEHGGYLNREEIEEKLRDESVVGIQWLDEEESENDGVFWKEVHSILFGKDTDVPLYNEDLEMLLNAYTLTRK